MMKTKSKSGRRRPLGAKSLRSSYAGQERGHATRRRGRMTRPPRRYARCRNVRPQRLPGQFR